MIDILQDIAIVLVAFSVVITNLTIRMHHPPRDQEAAMIDWFDRQGHPITIDQAEQLLGSRYKFVARDRFDGFLVSTVWLGLDHGVPGIDPTPLIFETMIFEDGPLNEECWRYSTEADAIAGHRHVVDLCRMETQLRQELWP